MRTLPRDSPVSISAIVRGDGIVQELLNYSYTAPDTTYFKIFGVTYDLCCIFFSTLYLLNTPLKCKNQS